jgi:hypothetical protein
MKKGVAAGVVGSPIICSSLSGVVDAGESTTVSTILGLYNRIYWYHLELRAQL